MLRQVIDKKRDLAGQDLQPSHKITQFSLLLRYLWMPVYFALSPKYKPQASIQKYLADFVICHKVNQTGIRTIYVYEIVTQRYIV